MSTKIGRNKYSEINASSSLLSFSDPLQVPPAGKIAGEPWEKHPRSRRSGYSSGRYRDDSSN